MSERHTWTGDRIGQYEIVLKGHLADHWSSWFDGLTLTRHDDGTTLVAGQVVDQAALHGLLQRVRDTGLPLVSVEYVAGEQPEAATPDSPESDHNITRRSTR